MRPNEKEETRDLLLRNPFFGPFFFHRHPDGAFRPGDDRHPSRSGFFVRSLDGQWRFKLEQAGDYPAVGSFGGKPHPIVLPKAFEPFQTLDYKEDPSWQVITVPGNWEMFGYSPATYNNPDNAIAGIYRLQFDVPAEWKDRVVKLNFDGVQNGAELYLNGQPVNVDESSDGKPNFHQGGFTAFQADLTPVVKFGEKKSARGARLQEHEIRRPRQQAITSSSAGFIGR